MKIKFKALLFLALIFCSQSCEKESIKEDNTSLELIKYEPLTNINSKSNKSVNIISLEDKMQWLSFMIAKVLLNDADTRQAVQTELDNSAGSSAIPLSNLIRESLTMQPNPDFNDEFRTEFYYQYNNPACGRPGSHRPKPIIDPGGWPPPPPESPYPIYDSYVNDLLLNNCFEVYFPNGITYLQIIGSNSGPNYTISTAHPLNQDSSNIGYRIEGNCRGTNVDVNNSTMGIVVVVRPYEDGTYVCDYDKYDVNDFTGFLE